MKAEIYVVSHKIAKMPQDKMYFPLQVGQEKENFPGFLRDNTGDNISEKNENYCELTAQYWAAKNRTADVKGLVHYRRLFSNGKKNFFSTIDKKFADVMTSRTMENLLSQHDMILPTKRNYYIETSWSQYAHAHHEKDLEITRQVIEEKFPNYLTAFDKWTQQKAVHKFNMFIAKAQIFDEYTFWLIDVLEEVEKRTDISDYSAYEKRIFGFLSEILIDVWVEANKVDYIEIPVMFMGSQHWLKKITNFLIRKVRGKANMK
ncbi:DUF4422 domain-containing protein [Ligilactobacillus sp. WILCCON 0076]|uniref:DUF4422 domain-containing protein n=1 Tax=Ligilactobacillus ubinensis TaxID=2876789 RepID=A0A9X2FL12_9LACO|nr:DUF4422 domain-containing protein [Ligilactobacillus ubinensis]MCP0887614.1 DUF4422 domain-containing protein [Ligilactobacillus ubinensis]